MLTNCSPPLVQCTQSDWARGFSNCSERHTWLMETRLGLPGLGTKKTGTPRLLGRPNGLEAQRPRIYREARVWVTGVGSGRRRLTRMASHRATRWTQMFKILSAQEPQLSKWEMEHPNISLQPCLNFPVAGLGTDSPPTARRPATGCRPRPAWHKTKSKRPRTDAPDAPDAPGAESQEKRISVRTRQVM